jgi:hypothetical protein
MDAAVLGLSVTPIFHPDPFGKALLQEGSVLVIPLQAAAILAAWLAGGLFSSEASTYRKAGICGALTALVIFVVVIRCLFGESSFGSLLIFFSLPFCILCGPPLICLAFCKRTK